MTGESERIARIDERVKAQKETIEKLEKNQRWAVLGILGLLAKAASDIFIGGVGL
jgi:hypothetical protein